MAMKDLRHELLTEMIEHLTDILVEYGINSEIAEHASHASADHLANHWGGQVISFPKDSKLKLAKRDIEIWDKFDGRNHAKLAKEFGMTVRAIYSIINKVKDRQMKLAQPGFFDNMEDS